MTGRPFPPEDLVGEWRTPERFVPAPELGEWAAATFVADGGPLWNPDHEHLQLATIGFLWTNAANRSQMRQAAATAEIPTPRGKPWVKARQEFQLREWFGAEPDFLITVDAVIAAGYSDAQFCALIEHELYHCAQAEDAWGGPRFTRDGEPVFAIRGHDAEEFVGIVRRYGAGNAAGGVAQLVEAAQHPPEVAAVDIRSACGVCLRAA